MAALDVADNDGEAAMLYHVVNLDKGGAAAIAGKTFVERMVADGIDRCKAFSKHNTVSILRSFDLIGEVDIWLVLERSAEQSCIHMKVLL